MLTVAVVGHKKSGKTTTTEKTPTDNLPIHMFLRKCKGNDIVFIEGLKEQVSKKSNILKICVNKNQDEATNAQQTYKPILAFSGPYNTQNIDSNIPYIDVLKNLKKLADLIEQKMKNNRVPK